MAMVSKEKILGSIATNLHVLSRQRAKQKSLINLAEMLGFNLRDVDQGLEHALMFGGASGPGDEWPLGWRQAQDYLTSEEVQAIRDSYIRAIDSFPAELKEQHSELFT
jgi:hypothetical protein